MKIDNLPGPNAAKTTDTRSTRGMQVGGGGGESHAMKSSQADSVTLTDTARRLRELQNQLADGAVVDSNRVQQIRDALSNGTYQIDPARVAEKLFRFEV